MSSIEIIQSDSAPKAVGPYSQAVLFGGVLYASGQIGLDPEAGKLVSDDVESQARQVTKNLSAVLSEAGASLSDILKVNIFLTDMGDFPRVNEIYAAWLGEHRPARATVAVAALPLGAKVEMDLIARIG
ncbi:2-iminobutanoate/2-iminopropanoate deaminase [Mariprofundus aestuarium]|uniref:2-iminobutanoate/2-iminopropanoate deaminase n=1 Tax=Mariprofundus aestuarium TaxID=1921086 RepID=A0A2K8KXG7_MARES|nr:RidA family protein [Mariprofundus aestuarium]ATX79563.1 2-iminobutanoate/2-iminopropanoate deaminase [Mariprofundus aestuarium]